MAVLWIVLQVLDGRPIIPVEPLVGRTASSDAASLILLDGAPAA